MAAMYMHKFGNVRDLELFVQGGIRSSKKVVSLDGKIQGLHGLTLVFNIPVVTVTFADATAVGLTYAEILAQILSDTASAITGKFIEGALQILDTDLSGAIDLDMTGTANLIFGFRADVDTVGTLFNPPGGSAPRVLFMGGNSQGDGYHLMTEE